MIATYHRPLIRSSAAALQVLRCRRAGDLRGQPSNLTVSRRCAVPETSLVIQRPFFNIADSKSRKKEYSEQRLIGYSMEQMYDVVSDVGKYNTFVPWCTRSQVLISRPGYLHCKLTIGFPPLNESYKSTVTLAKPNLVKSECVDGRLFNYLLAVWQFSPGLEANPKSCTLHFSVRFEFRSSLHSHVAEIFFNEVVRKNVEAFLGEARRRYGPPSIPPRRSPVKRAGAG